MQNIDVSDLPEPVARAIEVMVQTLRQQLSHTDGNGQSRDLPRWEGQVLGKLTREELYDNDV